MLYSSLANSRSQVISYLEIAMSGQLDTETREHLSKSHIASKSLLFNINDLLSLTRIESGNETTFSDPFELRQCVDDATALYKTEASRRNIEFTVDVDPELPTVVGDAQKIRTVISNLVANSGE
jgi:signal transduction histidine kinase